MQNKINDYSVTVNTTHFGGFFIAKNPGGKMALSLLAANNAQTVLAAGISSTATSLTVNAGTGTLFPPPVAGTSFFKLTIIDAATGSLTEIVHVTARAGDVFTIQRGQEGTVPRAWSANDIVANMMTAGTLSYILGNFQPLDPTLTALAALVGVSNKLPYFNGDDTAALTDLTQVGRDIIGKSTIADILTYLGLSKSRFAVVTSSQAITIPNWVTEIYVTASAGGGGGGGSGGSTNLTGTGAGGQGGGSGEFVVKRKFAVTPGSTINVTIGAEGTGGIAGTPSINGGNGTAGGGTVIGSLLTLNGGGGGHGGDSFMGSVLPGGGAGGTGYPAGQDGQDGANTIPGNGCGGNGGNSFFGGGAGGSRAGSAGVDGKDAYGYGSGGSGAGGGYGGSGGGSNGGVGGKGSSGIVIIEW
ncbi:hypothetical protein VC862_24595 [Citrobacter braakii]|uniref:glycine-rich domain-containing protein n=1 Tax=Citrobacter braakii TaxID=57706 RepID=UPI002B24C467|nr:hypothetical protein [Citrobacter braakii]MEB1007763.1 hypothetical protein [Citrobacter braakii]